MRAPGHGKAAAEHCPGYGRCLRRAWDDLGTIWGRFGTIWPGEAEGGFCAPENALERSGLEQSGLDEMHEGTLQRTQDAARHALELAEAELAVLKQELILQHLVDSGEPTEEARMALAGLRELAIELSARGSQAGAEGTGEAA